MPHLDGLGVLRALQRQDAPRVVVVSMSDAESALGVEALQAGALDVVHKPTALATDRLYELGHELRAKVLAAAQARSPAGQVDGGPEQHSASVPVEPATIRRGTALVAIGTSTGGPQALTRLISRFPADFPVPIVVALHIPAGYTQGLAARLDGASALRVVEASDGLALEPGMVAIAPGGRHLRIAPGSGDRLTVQIASEAGPDRSLHVPSVDLLFESAADRLGARVLGVVLTGMGDDGAGGRPPHPPGRRRGADRGRILLRRLRHAPGGGRGRAQHRPGGARPDDPADHPLSLRPWPTPSSPPISWRCTGGSTGTRRRAGTTTPGTGCG